MKIFSPMRLFITVLSAGLLFSCAKQVQNDYIRVIPGNAAMVLSYDAGSMNAKSEIPATEKEKMHKRLLETLQGKLGPNTLRQIEKIMTDPQESGLSVKDKIYAFLNADSAAGTFNGGIVVKVTDLNKLQQNFQLLATEQGCTAPVEKNGYWETSLEEKAWCAYNKELLLLLAGTDETSKTELPAMLARLMAQKPKNSIMDNRGFNKLNDRPNDIAYYLSAGKLTTFLSALASLQQPIPNQEMLQGMSVLTALNFEQGLIRLTSENYAETPEAQKWYEQQAAMSGPMKSVFLDCFPASSLVYMGLNINGEKLYDFLQNYPEETFREMFRQARQEGQIDLKKLFSAFQGDISLGFTSLSAQIPVITAYAEMKDDYLLDWFKSKKDSLGEALNVSITETGENAYNASIGGSITVYFGQKGNTLYLTNDPQAGQNAGASVDNPMSGAPWGKDAKNSHGILIINVNDLMKQPLIAMALSMAGNDEKMSLLRSVLAGCSYIEIRNTSASEGEIDIVLNNRNENALKQISAGLIQLAGNHQ